MHLTRSAIVAFGLALLGAAPGALAVPIPTGDTTLAADFIDLAYQDLLNRPPSLPEQAQFQNFLLAGHGDTSTVSTAIDTSTEYRQKLVTQYFQTYLQRAPGASELNLWVQVLQSGQTDQQVIAQFLGSAEFRAVHGIATNTQLVQQFYSTLLNRPPSGLELSAFVTQLNGGASADAVATEILQSTEYGDDVLTSLFNQLLGRTPSPATLQQIIALDLTDEQEIDLLVGSTEFLCKADPQDAICGGQVTTPPTQTPEPATLWLFGAGIAVLVTRRRR